MWIIDGCFPLAWLSQTKTNRVEWDHQIFIPSVGHWHLINSKVIFTWMHVSLRASWPWTRRWDHKHVISASNEPLPRPFPQRASHYAESAEAAGPLSTAQEERSIRVKVQTRKPSLRPWHRSCSLPATRLTEIPSAWCSEHLADSSARLPTKQISLSRFQWASTCVITTSAQLLPNTVRLIWLLTSSLPPHPRRNPPSYNDCVSSFTGCERLKQTNKQKRQ